jgi:hypothetical protein
VASDCLNLSIFFDTKLQVFCLCIKKGGKQVQFYTLLAYTNQGEKVERENTGNKVERTPKELTMQCLKNRPAPPISSIFKKIGQIR